MGKIKKILENELVGGTQNTDVYPVTSTKAVYDEDNENLDSILKRRGTINVSTNYNSTHIAETLTLEQAIAKVPSKDRVIGFTMTFLSSDGWKNYQFIGTTIDNWTDVNNWTSFVNDAQLKSNQDSIVEKLNTKVNTSDIVQQTGNSTTSVMSQKAVSHELATKADAEQVNNSLYNLEKKIGDRVVVNGNVTNLPDEEDLTSVNESDRDVLKLADRRYAPENFSGKGYKILRKNIVDGKNVLTQDMINEPNTIYEIRYDYVTTENIVLPDNVYLEFKGGRILSTNISGKVDNAFLYPDYFCDMDINEIDASDAINLCFKLVNRVKLKSAKPYYIYKPITMFVYSELIGDNGRATLVDMVKNDFCILHNVRKLNNLDILDKKNYKDIATPYAKSIIRNINFNAKELGWHSNPTMFEECHLLYTTGKIEINNCIFSFFNHVIYRPNYVDSIRIINCKLSDDTKLKEITGVDDRINWDIYIGPSDSSSIIDSDMGSIFIMDSHNFYIKGGIQNRYLSFYSSITFESCHSEVLPFLYSTNSNIVILNSNFTLQTEDSFCIKSNTNYGISRFTIINSCLNFFGDRNVHSLENTLYFDIGDRDKIYCINDTSRVLNTIKVGNTLLTIPSLSYIFDKSRKRGLSYNTSYIKPYITYDVSSNNNEDMLLNGNFVLNIYVKIPNSNLVLYKQSKNLSLDNTNLKFSISTYSVCEILLELIDSSNNTKKYAIYPSNIEPNSITIILSKNKMKCTHTGVIRDTIDNFNYEYIKSCYINGNNLHIESNVLINPINSILVDNDECVVTNILYKYYNKKWNIVRQLSNSTSRPELRAEDEGFEYYDSTLKKKILWNGSAWVNMDGTELS